MIIREHQLGSDIKTNRTDFLKTRIKTIVPIFWSGVTVCGKVINNQYMPVDSSYDLISYECSLETFITLSVLHDAVI